MELVIKIPEEVKQAFDCAESNDLKGSYYDFGGVIGNAIKNGTPLPKGHGKIVDAKRVLENGDNWEVETALMQTEAIVEADKDYEVKVITRGNCRVCGKELTEGLFFCKKCKAKIKGGE